MWRQNCPAISLKNIKRTEFSVSPNFFLINMGNYKSVGLLMLLVWWLLLWQEVFIIDDHDLLMCSVEGVCNEKNYEDSMII